MLELPAHVIPSAALDASTASYPVPFSNLQSRCAVREAQPVCRNAFPITFGAVNGDACLRIMDMIVRSPDIFQVNPLQSQLQFRLRGDRDVVDLISAN